MGKNPDLRPTKRAAIVEMRNQKIKFKNIANEKRTDFFAIILVNFFI